MSSIGPRYSAKDGNLKGTYSCKTVSFFMPTYTWEMDEEKSNNCKGFLSIIPETWFSDDFRYVLVPRTDEFYFVVNDPKTIQFNDFLLPDEDTWAEFDVCCVVRRNGCKITDLILKNQFACTCLFSNIGNITIILLLYVPK
jgi:hypothetical protein